MRHQLCGIWKLLLGDEQGAASVEYAILASLIAAVIAATVFLLGTQTKAAFCKFLINFSGSC